MKLHRVIVKTLVVVIVCILVFGIFQKLFHKRWNVLYENYVKYSKCEDVDLIIVGTSEIWCGIIPSILFEEQGIRSFNLGHSYKSAITTYYELEYAFKEKKPKVVLLDFAELVYSSTLPAEAESAFRQAIYSMPDKKIRRKILNEVWKYDTSEALYYEFPLLRFHNMWSSIPEENLTKEYDYNSIDVDFKLGWDSNKDLLLKPDGPGEKTPITEDRWNTEEDEYCLADNKVLVEYYDKCIKLCEDNGAIVIAVFPPKPYVIERQQKNWRQIDDYLSSRNVPILNYNTYEFYLESGLDYESDYFDVTHLNYNGAIKWSHYVGEDVMKILGEKKVEFEICDETSRERYELWTDEFNAKYKEKENDR
ncbi:MAG: hypothetical protein PUG10_00880 [Lachnospiraceae bacterium]|nr:hypothetical protein [Lachnospiraceae bacterium]